MAIRPILIYPDPRLRIQAQPVADFGPTVQILIEDLLETMYAADGLGLAATQLGDQNRVFVMDLSDLKQEPQVFINPVIFSRVRRQKRQEGCLSIPGAYEDVVRAARIHVRALDRSGQSVEKWAEGLEAVCIQHELDHLDGRLFIDHLSVLKRERLLKRFRAKRTSA
ncbi:Formylmethionine deformylase [mine drainage metagenome]|uniref:Formylmethionine deformylase n=1 Tax=mine drainage metagenome TaxID=410659 RepID=T0Y084_9ZZZZ